MWAAIEAGLTRLEVLRASATPVALFNIRSRMRVFLPISLCAVLCCSGVLFSASEGPQVQLVGSDYFPAELEFKELRGVDSGESARDREVLPGASEAALVAEAGYLRYARKSFQVEGGGKLTIEVLRAKDERSAYSLFSLLRTAKTNPGPPGESCTATGDALTFVKGSFWVRVAGPNPGDLLKRVAISVSNRIGPRDQIVPSLISHFPKTGLDESTNRYFLGPRAFEAFASKLPGLQFEFRPEMEIAQAEYNLKNQNGVLSLLGFPTGQIAGDYFDSISERIRPGAQRFYTRRIGPIVAILVGNFDPLTADEILGNIKFSYSIKWIYDKNNRSSTTVWGVPVGILGTVVRSLLLTTLLCGLSILLGVGLAVFRMFLRDYAPGNFLAAPERTEMIRLRLNENRIQPAATLADRDSTEPK